MSQKKEKWYNHVWVVVLGGVILAPFGTLLFDWGKELPILSTFKTSLNWVLNQRLLLGALLGFGVRYTYEVIFKFIQNKKAKHLSYDDYTQQQIDIADNKLAFNAGKEQELLGYIAEKIDGRIWEWHWSKNPIIKKYEMVELRPYCIKCDVSKMILMKDLDFYLCEKCFDTIHSSLGVAVKMDIEEIYKPLT